MTIAIMPTLQMQKWRAQEKRLFYYYYIDMIHLLFTYDTQKKIDDILIATSQQRVKYSWKLKRRRRRHLNYRMICERGMTHLFFIDLKNKNEEIDSSTNSASMATQINYPTSCMRSDAVDSNEHVKEIR